MVRKSLKGMKRRLGFKTIGWVAWIMFLTGMATGCRDRKQGGDSSLLKRFRHARVESPKPGELAERGRVEITEECAKQSYETAKKGLIISEIGLHEDVFMLRDLVSYGAIGYSLDEALRLESLLRDEASGAKHSAEEAACIERFAEHLESLSDPLVEGDERLRELDASAFQDAAKEAERQTEERIRQAQKPSDPKGHPQD
jgi:hypothetical protein